MGFKGLTTPHELLLNKKKRMETSFRYKINNKQPLFGFPLIPNELHILIAIESCFLEVCDSCIPAI